jgi:hypothetical protein
MSIVSILPGDDQQSGGGSPMAGENVGTPPVHPLGTSAMDPGHPIAGSLTCADAPPAAATTLSNAE